MAELRVGARLAVLIDADNVKVGYLESVLEEIAKYGTATVRRAYGDWSSGHLSAWKEPLLKHSVQPIHQPSYTHGKNSSDIALVIDAMDLLHSGTVDGFCLVTSDSDFTKLAVRIRDQGLAAYGFGESKTPDALRFACTKFILLENLIGNPVQDVEDQASVTPPGEVRRVATPMPEDVIAKAVDSAADDEGWANLSAVGSNLSRLKPDFDSRTWGYPKLGDLFRAHKSYTFSLKSPGDGKPRVAKVKRVKTR